MDWNNLAAQPEYQNATPEVQRTFQDGFFDEFVMPEIKKAGIDPNEARQEFYVAVRGSSPNTVSQALRGAEAAPRSTWLEGIATPEKIEELKAKGPIGIREMWGKTDKWGYVPFSGVFRTPQDVETQKIVSKIQEGGTLSISEEAQIRTYIEDLIETEARGVSLGAEIISMATMMAPALIEFASTRYGIGKAVKFAKGLRGGAGSATSAPKSTAVRVSQEVATLSATAAAQSALMPHRIEGAYARRALNESIAITEVGDVIFEQAKTAPATAWLMAYGDVFVENFSEGVGGLIGPPLSKATGKLTKSVVPEKVFDAIQGVLESTFGKGFSEAMRRLGWNGVLMEIGEERIADALSYALGLDEKGGRAYSFEDFMDAVTPTPDEALVELGAIALFGTASRVGYGLHRKLIDRGYTPEQARSIVQNMTETEQRQTLSRLVEQETSPTPARALQAFKDTPTTAAIVEQEAPLQQALQALDTFTTEERAELATRIRQGGLSSVVNDRIDTLERELTTEISKGVNASTQRVTSLEAEIARMSEVAPKRFSQAQADRVLAQATRIAQTDITASQEVLSNFITSSKIPDNVKVAELAKLSKIKSSAQAASKLPKIHARVVQAAEKQAFADSKASIRKALDKVKVTKTQGKRRSNVDAPTARRAAELKAFANLSQEKAIALLEGGTLANDPLASAVVSTVAGEGYASVGLMNTAVSAIEEMVQTGKAARADLKATREEALADTMRKVELALGEAPTKSKGNINKAITQELPRSLLGWFGVWRLRWLQAFQTKDSKLVDGLLDNELSVFQENLNFDMGRKKEIQAATDLMLRYTNMTEAKLMAKLWKDEKDEVRIAEGKALLHSDGVMRPVSLTRGQMRYIWVQSRNSVGSKALLSEKGNRFTPDIIQMIENEMTPEDVGIAKALTEFYRTYFSKVNSFVERTQGISLKQEQFYAPMMRDIANEGAEGFLEATTFFQKRSPRAIKEREGGEQPIKLLSDFSTLASHISEMEYYINVGEKASMLERLITSHDIAQRVRDVAGDGLLRDLQKDARYFATRGRHEQQFVSNTINTLVRNFQSSVLVAKPQIGLKQMTSFPAYVQGVKTKDFIAGLADLAAHPMKAKKVLEQSDFLKDRFGSLEALDKAWGDLASDRSALNVLGKFPKVKHYLGLPIRVGDATAISIGGYAHYYAKRKAGATHAEALRSMELLTVRTQQSAQIAELSFLQREPNFAARILTNFLSAPNALARAEYEALLQGIRGRITPAEAAKRFVVYHILIPNIFQIVANGLVWNEEDQLRASILGSLNGIFLIGSLLETMVTWGVKDEVWDISSRHPLEFGAQFLKALDQFEREDADLEDFFEGMKSIRVALKAAGGVFGVPLEQAYNMLVGGAKIREGEVAEAGALMLGYSPWVIENKILEDQNSGLRL